LEREWRLPCRAALACTNLRSNENTGGGDRHVAASRSTDRTAVSVSEDAGYFAATAWLNRSAKTVLALPVCFTACAASRLAGAPTLMSATMPMA
jgi:hypothetical protein